MAQITFCSNVNTKFAIHFFSYQMNIFTLFIYFQFSNCRTQYSLQYGKSVKTALQETLVAHMFERLGLGRQSYKLVDLLTTVILRKVFYVLSRGTLQIFIQLGKFWKITQNSSKILSCTHHKSKIQKLHLIEPFLMWLFLKFFHCKIDEKTRVMFRGIPGWEKLRLKEYSRIWSSQHL